MTAASSTGELSTTQRELRRSRRSALEELSKDELIDLILEIETSAEDDTLQVHRPTGTRTFDLPWEPRHFIRLAANPGHEHGADTQVWRRMALVSIDLAHPVIGLELRGGVVIGRGAASDLDLTEYDAFEYGISRQHALLTAADRELKLTDLNSSNGTRCNDERLVPNVPFVLQHGDFIDFGSLRFQFRIID